MSGLTWPHAVVMSVGMLVVGALALRGMVPVTVVATLASGIVMWLVPSPTQRLPPPPPPG